MVKEKETQGRKYRHPNSRILNLVLIIILISMTPPSFSFPPPSPRPAFTNPPRTAEYCHRTPRIEDTDWIGSMDATSPRR